MGEDENIIVTTFYVEGEVSLCWDRKTGEFVSLHMNSTLVPDDDTDGHAPLTSVASSPFLICDSDVRDGLRPPSLTTGRSGPHTWTLDCTESSCANADIAASSKTSYKPSKKSAKSSVPVANARPHAPVTQASAKGLFNPSNVKMSTSVELPSLPIIQSKTSTHKSKSEKTESAESSARSVLPSASVSEDSDASSHPTTNWENLRKDNARTRSPAVDEDDTDSAYSTTNQTDPENKRRFDSVLVCEASSRNAQSSESNPFAERETRLNLSPCLPADASCGFISTSSEKSSADGMSTSSEKSSADGMPTSHPSIERTGHEEPSTRSSEDNHHFSSCSAHTIGGHCLRSACKGGVCRANLTPSLEKSSPDIMSNSRLSSERTSYEEPSRRLSEKNHTDEEPSTRSSETSPACSTASGTNTAMNVSFYTDEVAKATATNEDQGFSLAVIAQEPKQPDDWASKTASPSVNEHSGFPVIDCHSVVDYEESLISVPNGSRARTEEPFPPLSTTQPPGVEATLEMDIPKHEVSKNSQMDVEAASPSSNENGKSTLLVSLVDEKPTLYTATLSSLPPLASETRTSVPLDSVEEKPAFSNPVINRAHLFDFANTSSCRPADAKQNADPLNPVDTKTGKRSWDATSSSTNEPAVPLSEGEKRLRESNSSLVMLNGDIASPSEEPLKSSEN